MGNDLLTLSDALRSFIGLIVAMAISEYYFEQTISLADSLELFFIFLIYRKVYVVKR